MLGVNGIIDINSIGPTLRPYLQRYRLTSFSNYIELSYFFSAEKRDKFCQIFQITTFLLSKGIKGNVSKGHATTMEDWLIDWLINWFQEFQQCHDNDCVEMLVARQYCVYYLSIFMLFCHKFIENSTVGGLANIGIYLGVLVVLNIYQGIYLYVLVVWIYIINLGIYLGVLGVWIYTQEYI